LNKQLLEAITEQFMTIFPLLHKKVFKAPPVDQMEYHLSPTNMEVL